VLSARASRRNCRSSSGSPCPGCGGRRGLGAGLRSAWAQAPRATTAHAAMPEARRRVRMSIVVVIAATVENQLGGCVERQWHEGGLVCDVAVPIARVLAGGGAETAA